MLIYLSIYMHINIYMFIYICVYICTYARGRRAGGRAPQSTIFANNLPLSYNSNIFGLLLWRHRLDPKSYMASNAVCRCIDS